MTDTATTAGRLRGQIEEDILSGHLAPQERLDETALAQRFGVSRTPVREALHQLATAGLVEIRPRRGAVVAALGPQDLFEMFEVMAELEAMCARLAARRLNDEMATALKAAHAACRTVQADPDAYYDENEVFHRLIYRASGNAFLADQCEALQKRLRPYRRLQLRVRHRPQASFAEHERVVEALLAGDGAAAAAALRDHVTVQGERFADLVAGLKQFGVA